MGGFIRRVFKSFVSKPSPAPVAQVIAAAPVAKTTISGASKSAKVRGAGYGTTTVMTEGMDETEANVAQTTLGGTKKKKKYVQVIEAVTDKKWKKSVGDYVKYKAHIYQELKENYSFIGFIEGEKVLGGLLFSDYDKYNVWVHLAL